MHAWKAALMGCLVIMSFGSANAQMPDALTGASPSASGDHWSGNHSSGAHSECLREAGIIGEPAEGTDMMARWADELGLTGQQRSDFQIIVADYAPRFRDLARIGRESAQGLMTTPPDDPAYVGMTQQASALAASSAAELVTLLAEMRGKLYSVLTDSQRAAMAARQQEIREKIEACKQAAAAAEESNQ